MSTTVQPEVSKTTPAPRDQRDAAEAFDALVAEHPTMRVEEWDTNTLDEKLRETFYAFYLERKDGTRILVVPVGQDPVVRLHAVRALLAHQEVTA